DFAEIVPLVLAHLPVGRERDREREQQPGDEHERRPRALAPRGEEGRTVQAQPLERQLWRAAYSTPSETGRPVGAGASDHGPAAGNARRCPPFAAFRRARG